MLLFNLLDDLSQVVGARGQKRYCHFLQRNQPHQVLQASP